MIKKYKVGQVQLKKDKSGTTVGVGNPKAKDPRYVTNVEIIIRDGSGNVLAKAENGFLQVVNPRKRMNKDGSPLSEDQLAKIPDYIMNELYLVVDDGQSE